MFSHYNGRKRGPKDAPNGLRLKLLAEIARHGYASRKDLERAYRLTASGVLYHLRQLLEAGYIVRTAPKARSPYQGYTLPQQLMDARQLRDQVEPIIVGLARAHGQPHLALIMLKIWSQLAYRPQSSVRKLARSLGLGYKLAKRALGLLRAAGLAVKLPHDNCPYGIWVAYPYPIEQPSHSHPEGFRGHRYRRQRTLWEYWPSPWPTLDQYFRPAQPSLGPGPGSQGPLGAPGPPG